MFGLMIIVQKHYRESSAYSKVVSCLRPVMYILYTNYRNYLMKDFNPILFADDTILVYVAENITVLSLQLNLSLYKISD